MPGRRRRPAGFQRRPQAAHACHALKYPCASSPPPAQVSSFSCELVLLSRAPACRWGFALYARMVGLCNSSGCCPSRAGAPPRPSLPLTLSSPLTAPALPPQRWLGGPHVGPALVLGREGITCSSLWQASRGQPVGGSPGAPPVTALCEAAGPLEAACYHAHVCCRRPWPQDDLRGILPARNQGEPNNLPLF